MKVKVSNRIYLYIGFIVYLILLTWNPDEYYSEWIFWILLAILGIPHGAIDHLIYFRSKSKTKQSLSRFYWQYLSLMLVTFMAWIFWPTISFIAFLGISAYHFGQSQLYYLNTSGVTKNVLFFSWGSVVITGIIALNFEQFQYLFSGLPWLQLGWSTQGLWNWWALSSGLITLMLLLFFYLKKAIPFQTLGVEIVGLLLLTSIAYMSDALVAFAVYFGIWHSLQSLLLEYNALKWSQGVVLFVKKLLPYTVVSILGLWFTHLFAEWIFLEISPIMIFIVVVSALTVPHLFVMHGLFTEVGHRTIKY